ncbi:MAG: DUF5615 family PIN-like protein [Chloroflexi bacterium]|nr:DUF5615 family PIN-like protein [Chloroflexota bacterium]
MASAAPHLYIALYTDEDVYGVVAEQIRANGYDALSVFEAQKMGLEDYEQLEFAIAQERAILTHNMGDFERLHKQYQSERKQHFGIVVAPQWEIGVIIKRVLNMLDRVDAEQMKNQYHHLGEFK